MGRQRAPKYQTGRYFKPYLRVANVLEDEIDVSDIYEMDFDMNDLAKYKLEYGDILITEGGSIIGRPAIWRGEVSECCYDKHILRFRVNAGILQEFAFVYLLNIYRSGFYGKNSNNPSGIPFIGIGKFQRYPFFVPPVELQEEFARQFVKVREILGRIKEKETRLDAMMQALSAQAFTGALTAAWRETNPDLASAIIIPTVKETSLRVIFDVASTVTVNAKTINTAWGRNTTATRLRRELRKTPGTRIRFEDIENFVSNPNAVLKDITLQYAENRSQYPTIQTQLEEREHEEETIQRSLAAALKDEERDILREQLRELNRQGALADNLRDNQRQQASEMITDFQQSYMGEGEKEDPVELASIVVLSPKNPAHPRADFWADVVSDSLLRVVYDYMRIGPRYMTALTLAHLQEELGEEPTAEHKLIPALNTLEASGLIRRVALAMPDPAEQKDSGIQVLIHAYCLTRLDEMQANEWFASGDRRSEDATEADAETSVG